MVLIVVPRDSTPARPVKLSIRDETDLTRRVRRSNCRTRRVTLLIPRRSVVTEARARRVDRVFVLEIRSDLRDPWEMVLVRRVEVRVKSPSRLRAVAALRIESVRRVVTCLRLLAVVVTLMRVRVILLAALPSAPATIPSNKQFVGEVSINVRVNTKTKTVCARRHSFLVVVCLLVVICNRSLTRCRKPAASGLTILQSVLPKELKLMVALSDKILSR